MAAPVHLPTIAIIPGAFHTPSHFSSLCAQLKKAGYDTASVQVPSVDPPTAAAAAVATPSNDALFIREKLLLPLIEEEGKDVVLLMHSYGGIPGSGSAVGLSKKEREREREVRGEKEKKKGGLVGLVFVTAYVAREGQTVRKDLASQDRNLVERSLAAVDVDVSIWSLFFFLDGGGGSLARD